MIPPELNRDLQLLRSAGLKFKTVIETQKAYVWFNDYKLPASVYNKNTTDLLILTLTSYPKAGFDMFWVDSDVTLCDGRTPNAADVIECHVGKLWRRFSYHPYQNEPWSPSEDNVASFINYVDQRLGRGD